MFALPLVVLSSIGGWVLTSGRAAAIDYRYGSYLEPGGRAGDSWTYRSKSLSVWSTNGLLGFRFSGYSSYADSREGLRYWDGTVGWTTFVFEDVPTGKGTWMRWQDISNFSLLGLGLASGSRQGEDTFMVTIPYWLLAVGAAGTGWFLWAPVRRRRNRLASGRCLACGYDLAAKPVNSPCPECGTPAKPEPP